MDTNKRAIKTTDTDHGAIATVYGAERRKDFPGRKKRYLDILLVSPTRACRRKKRSQILCGFLGTRIIAVAKVAAECSPSLGRTLYDALH